jgi:hypothetical protein
MQTDRTQTMTRRKTAPSPPFRIGARVRYIAALTEHRGKTGTVEDVDPRTLMMRVRLDDGGAVRAFGLHLEPLTERTPSDG